MSTMSCTSASLPIATVEMVILSFAIRRSSPWKSPRVILGEVELGHLLVGGHRHRAGAVDREHDGEARDLDLLLDLHRDRQRLLDRRAVVAAEAEALFAAEHDEAAAVLAHVVADVAHLGARQLERRDVREHEAVVLLQARRLARDPGGLDNRDLDVLRTERRREGLRVAPVLLGEQHLGPTAYYHGADRAVVLLD